MAFLPRYRVCSVEFPFISIWMHSHEKSDKSHSTSEICFNKELCSNPPAIGSRPRSSKVFPSRLISVRALVEHSISFPMIGPDSLVRPVLRKDTYSRYLF